MSLPMSNCLILVLSSFFQFVSFMFDEFGHYCFFIIPVILSPISLCKSVTFFFYNLIEKSIAPLYIQSLMHFVVVVVSVAFRRV